VIRAPAANDRIIARMRLGNSKRTPMKASSSKALEVTTPKSSAIHTSTLRMAARMEDNSQTNLRISDFLVYLGPHNAPGHSLRQVPLTPAARRGMPYSGSKVTGVSLAFPPGMPGDV
jgi:hypothetical protein